MVFLLVTCRAPLRGRTRGAVQPRMAVNRRCRAAHRRCAAMAAPARRMSWRRDGLPRRWCDASGRHRRTSLGRRTTSPSLAAHPGRRDRCAQTRGPLRRRCAARLRAEVIGGAGARRGPAVDREAAARYPPARRCRKGPRGSDRRPRPGFRSPRRRRTTPPCWLLLGEQLRAFADKVPANSRGGAGAGCGAEGIRCAARGGLAGLLARLQDDGDAQ